MCLIRAGAPGLGGGASGRLTARQGPVLCTGRKGGRGGPEPVARKSEDGIHSLRPSGYGGGCDPRVTSPAALGCRRIALREPWPGSA
jgi:hypothetical protein